MFPIDAYTPHGYLDNPAHAWKLQPSGVLRSRPALGMGWYYPSFPHGYNYIWQYAAYLQIAIELPDGWHLLPLDFKDKKLYSNYHSKNWFSLVCDTAEWQVQCVFYLAQEMQNGGDALGCLVRVLNHQKTSQTFRLAAILDYQRNLNAGSDWTSGLYTRSLPTGITVAGFQEGVALHLGSFSDQLTPTNTDRPLLEAATLSEMAERLAGKIPTNPPLPDPADLTEPGENVVRRLAAREFSIECPAEKSGVLQLVVTRDVTEFAATRRAAQLLADSASLLYEAMAFGKAADDAFWKDAPTLSGDWEGHVRRGMVYDFETLRMMVRNPTGIYTHRWDAMQLQVPRTVLAEVALDMLILSYADPAAALEVIYGAFASSPEPNLPCSREDGSYNMVAMDGSPCGTAPEWCFPFQCIKLLYARTGDREWLAKLYPYLEKYIDWWLTYRTDAEGKLFYKCSWEAGQDNSARFMLGEDPTGGAMNGEHLWPVDLQAAVAQACTLLAAWGTELDKPTAQVERWHNQATRHTQLAQQMWQPDKSWFHDYDRRTSGFTAILDTMQLAPLLCGVTTADQRAQLLQKLENPPSHGQVFHPLMWASIVFCLVEACSETEHYDLAARHSWQVIEAVYRWLDSRPDSIAPTAGGLPGVGREYFPQVSRPDANPPRGGGGSEVYGWGCISAYLLIRYVIGFQELTPKNDGKIAFRLAPNLPPQLLIVGKEYRISNLPCRNAKFNVTYIVEKNLNLRAKFSIFSALSGELLAEQEFSLSNSSVQNFEI